MASVLETIIRDAKVDFLIAKHDGVLEASEIVHIALSVAQKVHALGSISDEEKDAMIVLSLKKGLAAAGGMPLVGSLPPAVVEGLENQLFQAGLAAVKAMRGVAPRLFAPAKNALLACLPYCSQLAGVASSVLAPKDAAMIQEALKCAELVAGKKEEVIAVDPAAAAAPAAAPAPAAEAVVSASQESAVTAVLNDRPAESVEVDIPLPNTVHEEPNPAASQ
jgi:hypothetical protein